MTVDEFKTAVRRMFDSMRSSTLEIEEDDFSCHGVSSYDCPIRKENNGICLTHCPLLYSNGCDIDDIFKVLETVEKWSKEHLPVLITHKSKCEEVHGREPKDCYGKYICPLAVALIDCPFREGKKVSCNECASKFWNSEYVELSNGEE